MSQHVMLVEDNVSFRKVMRAILKAHLPAVKISEAEGEREALATCRKEVPDLVLMDLELADGDGLRLTRQIKRLSPETVVVVVTGNDYPEYEKAAYRSGAEGFISKRSGSLREIVRLLKTIANEKF